MSRQERQRWAPRKYILGGEDGRTPTPCDDLMQWGSFLEDTGRLVAFSGNGDLYVSTVFLGLDHNFSLRGPPVLFETMVFRGTTTISGPDGPREVPASSEEDGEFERYSTWAEAEEGHKRIAGKVFARMGADSGGVGDD